MNPFHTKAYAENYFARRGTYPPGYDPNAPEVEPEPEPTPTVAEAAWATKFGRVLNYHCKGYKINDTLADCREINDKVRCTLAIINGLMSNLGYCYASDEQLAIYMHMTLRSAQNLLQLLWKKGFIVHIGLSGGNIKRVVSPEFANNPERTQKVIVDYNRAIHSNANQ